MKDRVVFLGLQDTIYFTRYCDCACDRKWECRDGYYTSDRGDQPIRGKFVLKVELFLLGFQDTICFTRYSDCACVGSGNVEMDIIRVTGVTNQSEVNLY